MQDLMMILLDAFGDINEGQVLHIEWANLQDNMAESKVGWSFLDDVRNQSNIDRLWWLWRRIMQKPDLKQQFVQSTDPMRWQQRRIMKFEQDLVRLQELVLFSWHFTGGQPCWAPSILSVQHWNTSNGGICNIGVEHRMMFYTPRADKNYMQTGNMKILHHWLPQEVGELTMYYLCPFIWGRPALEEKREREDAKVAKQPVQLEDIKRGFGKAEQPTGSDDREDDLEEAEQPVQSEEIETIDNEVYKSASIWKREWTSA
ncbi:hypothetical protein V502_03626 [Pseudogymnoascus sp. VKM F-4520 (FW-2644)]|nr:hypothetical protein V502_03626 [Pseudogymnoascus sp. VKM F-4520 (FW-2644)]